MTKYVAYARVSTERQGKSGLGLEAQEATIRGHLLPDDKLLMPVMVEVETGKATDRDRPVLAAALAKCRLRGATLIIAKVDRLARNRAFMDTIIAGNVPVVFCDVPATHGATGRFILGMMAEIAQLEAGQISERTKAALQAAKARGKRLGGYRPGASTEGLRRGPAARSAKADAFAATVGPTLVELRDAGNNLAQIAAELTAQGIVTPRGGAWTATAVRRALARQAV
jgi:DNA invertase Pin-like site-specific DNA recombinase